MQDARGTSILQTDLKTPRDKASCKVFDLEQSDSSSVIMDRVTVCNAWRRSMSMAEEHMRKG